MSNINIATTADDAVTEAELIAVGAAIDEVMARPEDPPVLSAVPKEVLGTDPEEFDWNTDDSIILREQRATAAYRSRHGELIIRQRASWSDDGDTFIYISPENEITFLEGLAAKAKE